MLYHSTAIKCTLTGALLLLFLLPVYGENPDNWQFVFMTDIHIQPEARAVEGFRQALRHAESYHPDFIVTGGDLIMDALAATAGRADSLYRLYVETLKSATVPVYNTLGNHEVFGWSKRSQADPKHPDYGKRMFERYLGRRHYSFDHKGWHFIILDSVIKPDSGSYAGGIDSVQLAWLQGDLSQVSSSTPIAAVTHIPLLTCVTQLEKGAMAANAPNIVIGNSREVLDAFNGYNLRLVLQGHLHYLEDVFVRGQTHFLTGGAVSAKWWEGAYNGLEEGYVLVKVTGDDISWEYLDYGWEVSPDATK